MRTIRPLALTLTLGLALGSSASAGPIEREASQDEARPNEVLAAVRMTDPGARRIVSAASGTLGRLQKTATRVEAKREPSVADRTESSWEYFQGDRFLGRAILVEQAGRQREVRVVEQHPTRANATLVTIVGQADRTRRVETLGHPKDSTYNERTSFFGLLSHGEAEVDREQTGADGIDHAVSGTSYRYRGIFGLFLRGKPMAAPVPE